MKELYGFSKFLCCCNNKYSALIEGSDYFER